MNDKNDKKTKGAKWQIPSISHPGFGKATYILEGELKERFCKMYPRYSNRRLMRMFGVSVSVLDRFKRDLGLEKDLRTIYRQGKIDMKRTCEKKGIYAAMRGIPPAAAVEATKKKWAEGYHPMRQLKKINPRKYKRVCKKWSEKRKELFRKERRRVELGLEQKTHIRINLYPLGRKASSQKYEMISCCNYFAVEGHPFEVCYDSETRRSAQREATAIRHGLRIVAGEDNND